MGVDPLSEMMKSFFGKKNPVPESLALHVLGLDVLPDVPGEVQAAFRELMKVIHPDVAGVANAADRLTEAKWARDVVLARIEKRDTYQSFIVSDHQTSQHSEGSSPATKIDDSCKVCHGKQKHDGKPFLIHGFRHHAKGVCWACASDADNAAVRDARQAARSDLECQQCAATFTPARSDARYCSPACRTAGYRARRGGAR